MAEHTDGAGETPREGNLEAPTRHPVDWMNGTGIVLRSELPACTAETALDATQRDALAGDLV